MKHLTKEMSRLFFWGIILVSVFGCTCCHKGGEEKTYVLEEEAVPAWERMAVTEEDITLDWYINYSWFATKWGGNVVSDEITNETGVSVNFITPMGNETEKLNALIASDSLPDLITLEHSESQLDEMIDKEMVYALNELADQYDPLFWEVTDPVAVTWYTREDGNIYSYPNSTISPADFAEHPNEIGSNETFLVRKDIYEALGCPDMTTQEGFYQAVKDAVRLFPEVDGQPLIPVGSHVFDSRGCTSFDTYLMDFLAVDQERDGRIYDRYTDPEYLSWLKFFRKLAEEGYLKNDIFVDTRPQMEEKLAEGRYFCMIYQYMDMLTQQKTLYTNNPDSVYIAVEGPRNSCGEDPKLGITGINGWTVTLISKNCRHPDRAIAFIDYLISERGQMLTYLGKEGETYYMKEGKPVLYEEVKELLSTDRIEYDRLYGADNAYWMLQNNVMQLKWNQETPHAIWQMEKWSRKYAVYNGQYDIRLVSDSKEGIMDAAIDRLWSETLPQLLLASSDREFDEILSDFVKKRKEAGFEELMEIKTEYMKAAKEKLGIS